MKQRTISQIKQSVSSYAIDELGLSQSPVAEWRILQEIFVYAIWVFEGIMVLFQKDINETIQTKQPPTLDWWYKIVKAFQYEHDLIIDENGILGYAEIDEEKKIISQALLTEQFVDGSDYSFKIKVAKEGGSGLEKLADDEEIAFRDYIHAMHPPGANYEVYSGNPDLISFTKISIEYNPKYTYPDINGIVQGQLEAYRDSVNFNKNVYKESMLAKVIEHPAIYNAYFTGLEGKAAGGTYATINHEYVLEAGYFNFDVDWDTDIELL